MSTRGTYYHVIWDCPLIQAFWKKVVSDINAATSLPVSVDTKVLLLGITKSVTHSTHTRLLLFYLCFYARKVLLQHWKLAFPPTAAQWYTLVGSVLPLYKLTYMGRKCPQKFDKVWVMGEGQIAQPIALEVTDGETSSTPSWEYFELRISFTCTGHTDWDYLA